MYNMRETARYWDERNTVCRSVLRFTSLLLHLASILSYVHSRAPENRSTHLAC